MEDEVIGSVRRQQRQLLAWTLWLLGLAEASTDLSARAPSPLPAKSAPAVEAAIDCARAMERRVRDQVLARAAFS